MNKRETTEVLALLKVAYPQSFNKLTNEDLHVMVNLWQRQFEEYPQQDVLQAVDGIISSDTSAFSPTIAKVKEMIQKLRNPQPNGRTEIDAWNHVRRALKNSAWHAEEEFEKLDDDLKRLVGSASTLREWALMDSEQVETVVASNFQRSYKAMAARNNEFNLLPAYIKLGIEIKSDEKKGIECLTKSSEKR